MVRSGAARGSRGQFRLGAARRVGHGHDTGGLTGVPGQSDRSESYSDGESASEWKRDSGAIKGGPRECYGSERSGLIAQGQELRGHRDWSGDAREFQGGAVSG